MKKCVMCGNEFTPSNKKVKGGKKAGTLERKSDSLTCRTECSRRYELIQRRATSPLYNKIRKLKEEIKQLKKEIATLKKKPKKKKI